MLVLFLAALPLAVPSPGQIAQAAPAEEWVRIADDDLMVMSIERKDAQPPRRERVVVQLMPAPVAADWVANIRRLAKARWWDGTSVNRVQDNYVAQWGDATEKKPLPPGLTPTTERGYDMAWSALLAAGHQPREAGGTGTRPSDIYAADIDWYRGFPIASDGKRLPADRRAWPVHCYGSVGVGRNLSPDAGSGAELYAVIGHAPRHLDRNIAVVGRVIDGMEHLSSLPRGTGDLGFYEKPSERVKIVSVRMANDLPAAERPHFAYLSSGGTAWPRYVAARRNRELPFFTRPAGAADICNIPVPTKEIPSGAK